MREAFKDDLEYIERDITLHAFDARNPTNHASYSASRDVNIASALEPGLWGLDRIGQRRPPLDGVYNPRGNNTGSGVHVYIIDTGINPDHVQYADRMGPGFDFVDDDDVPDDCNGHGTHCAGIIGADKSNNLGIAGAAGGTAGKPGVKLQVLTTFGKTGTSGFAQAITYGADNGAWISSNSWGYTSPGAYSQSVLTAIDYFNANGKSGAGGIVVFAAGNDNSDQAYYPGLSLIHI